MKDELDIEELLNSDEVKMVNLCTGERPDGSSFYVYLSQTYKQMQEFNEGMQKGLPINFEDYGEVLTYGDGDQPPDDVIKQVESEHGLNHKFEEELLAKYEELKEESERMKKLGLSKEEFVKKKFKDEINSAN